MTEKDKTLPRILVFLVVGLLANLLVADETGKALFAEGSYDEALERFLDKRQRNEGSAANDYNVALTLYRLERFDEAQTEFQKLTDDDDYAALAHYHLGLIAQHQSRHEDAERHFERAANARSFPAVASVARSRLVDARPTGATDVAGESVRNSAGMLFVRAGHDTNAISLAEDLATGQGEDNYIETLGYGQTYLSGRRGSGWKLDGFAFVREYRELGAADAQILSAGLRRERTLGDFDAVAGIRMLHSRIGGATLANQVQVDLELARQLGRTRISAAYVPSRYFSGSGFPQLDGWRHRLELEASRALGTLTVGARYRHDINERDDLETSAAFYSYSPTRDEIRASMDWDIAPRFGAKASVAWRTSDYDGINCLVDSNGSFREASRSNDRFKVTTEIDYQVARPLTLTLAYDHVESDDTFERYTYDKSRLYFGLEYDLFSAR